MKPIYTVSGLRQIYRQRTVLSIEQLEIYPFETLAIVGPSGAGKSTLLRLLALLERPTIGRVELYLDGEAITESTITIRQRRRLAMVFQQPALLSRSVHQNIVYGLRLRGESGWQAHVEDLIESFQLSHVADAPAHTLSGGEKQRVALARALVLKPDILIMDEPTANLDPYNIRIIETLMQQHRQDMTIIMVTHNIFQAKRLADRVALVLDSHLIEVSSTQTFFNKPQDRRTAAFIDGDIIY